MVLRRPVELPRLWGQVFSATAFHSTSPAPAVQIKAEPNGTIVHPDAIPRDWPVQIYSGSKLMSSPSAALPSSWPVVRAYNLVLNASGFQKRPDTSQIVYYGGDELMSNN